jgi:GT2 family glycosyltransferase
MMSSHTGTSERDSHTRECPCLAVVILNWNGWRDTLECLESIYRSQPPFEWQVVVVDNGSGDQSVEKIQQWAEGRIAVTSRFFRSSRDANAIPNTVINGPSAEECDGYPPSGSVSSFVSENSMPLLTIIRLPQNLGYAGGNNVGIRYALQCGFRYIGLLNNDTVVDPETLGQLVNYLNKDQAVGIVGVKTLYYDDPDRIWWAGTDLDMYRGLSPFRETGCQDGPAFSGVRPTDAVSGHALFAKREVFEKVGLLDEDLFLIWEDTDLCLRTKRGSPYRICVNLDVHLWHKGGGISSTGATSPATVYFANRNRLKVVWRYGTWTQRVAFLSFYLVSRVPKFSLLALKGKLALIWAELRAMGSYVSGAPPRL